MGLPLFSEKARRASLCFLRKYEVFPLRLFSFFFFSRTLGEPATRMYGSAKDMQVVQNRCQVCRNRRW